MRLAEPLGTKEDEGAASLDHVLVATALSVARAEDAAALNAALSQCLDLLSAADTSGRYALCEVSAEADGRPVIVWQLESPDFGIAEGEKFIAWFSRARRGLGAFEPVRGEGGAGILLQISGSAGWENYAGLFVSDGAPTGLRAEKLAALAGLVAAALGGIARRRLDEMNRRRLLETNRDALQWLELGADIVWEAMDDGILHCRRVLNRRNDIAALVEGTNLRSVLVGASGRNLFDLLREERSVRHLSARLDGDADRTGRTLYVSGLKRDSANGSGASFAGTFTCVQARAASAFADEAALALTQVRASRAREEEMRIEAEAMLEGLRLLLASSTSREKLARLTQLLSDAMRAAKAMIVEATFDGRLRILAPTWEVLDRSHAPIVRALSQDLSERTLRLYESAEGTGEAICHGLGLEGDRILALALPLKSQTAYFLCAARSDFNPAGLAFAERFALLLRQALLLREEQSQLAQTAKMAALGQMSASIAHELKQPLNTISLAAQNLEAILSAPKFNPVSAEAKIARVLAQVDRAANVIDRMRRFGRKSIGENGPVELRDVAEEVVAMMRHVVERAGVEVTLDIAPNLKAHADRLEVEQVLTNLIQNAIDAISGVGVEGADREGAIRIAGIASAEDATVELRVEDNGPGFPPGVAERALEPFFTTKPAEQGTGLGLAICDAIVRESGGRIELGNHAEGGFVSLHLPRAAA